jgi:hypothetical protein
MVALFGFASLKGLARRRHPPGVSQVEERPPRTGRRGGSVTAAANRPIVNVAQALCDAELRSAIIYEYREALRFLMTCRIAVMGGDEGFQSLAGELAGHLGCDLVDAGMLLHPVARAISEAAEAAHV